MMVKVCGLRDRANIDQLRTAAPDFIGLIFYRGSPRFVRADPNFRKYIRELKWTQKVGVFVDALPVQVLQAASAYALDFVQLHGQEPPEVCKRIAAELPVIKALTVGASLDTELLSTYRQYCTYWLLDTAGPGHGGTGRQFDWALLNDSRLDHPFFLSGGIGPEDADRIRSLKHPGLAGIDINSRFEDQPAVKNISRTQKFIHELRHQ